MSKTLYRIYRPKTFDDVLGQEHIIKTLKNAINQDRIGHAYLFTGPRGTGKTTVARLFSVAINTQKRKGFDTVSKEVAKRLTDGSSMDVIEIDAASNTGVDDIRTLKETVNVTPTEAKYKTYIIDEVHMLSTNAFNALLKTLEEPPEHAIFILATTEIHKVPKTILSRCQRFDFARFSTDIIVKKLSIISKKEKINISPEALEMIATVADGGMRDAESLLAQVFALGNKNIKVKEVSQILGTTTAINIINFINALVYTDIEAGLQIINNTIRNGYNMETFIRSIIDKLRILLFLSINTKNDNIKNLISVPKEEINDLQNLAKQSTPKIIITMIEECTTALQKTKNTTILQLPLEIAVINICSNLTKSQKTTTNIHSEISSTETKTKSKQTTKKIDNEIEEETQSDVSKDNQTKWKKCVKQLETQNKSLASLILQCDLKEITTEIITLTTTFSFYKDKILQTKNCSMIENIIRDIFDTPLKIKIIKLDKKNKNSSELLSYATQIMTKPITE